MKWYHYIACFFAGIFFVNTLPHLLHGISGDPFPSPFATPPGKGPSSAMVNTLWGLFNLAVAILLIRAGKVSKENKIASLIFFIGFVIGCFMLTVSFVDKEVM